MLVERLYSLGSWAKENPVKTAVIVVAGVTGLAALLIPDVQSTLITFLRQATDVEGAMRFQKCMDNQAKSGVYGCVASSNCGGIYGF